MPVRFLLICITCTLSSFLYANEIDVLVIEGQESSFDRAISNSRENFKTITNEAADLLVGLPGLQVDSRSNFAQDTRLSIRGFGARSAFGIRGIDLIQDGIPINTPDGQGQLSSIQPGRLESVQIISGPLSVLYGNSPGGVILMHSHVPQENRLSLQHAFSNQQQSWSSLNANIRENNLAIATQLNYQESETDRPHSQAQRRQESLAIYYTTDNQLDWIFKFDQSRDPLLEDPLGLTPQQFKQDPFQQNQAAIDFNTHKQVENRQISLMLRNRLGETRWQLGLWKTQRAIEQYLGFSGDALTSAGGVVDLQRDSYGLNANITREFNWLDKNWQWTIGTEMTLMEDDRQGFVNQMGERGDLRRNETGEVRNRDIFTLIEFWPSRSTRIFLGSRLSEMDFSVDDHFVIDGINPDDSGKKDFSESATAIGLEYEFADSWTLFASASQGFETPTLTEMAYRSDGNGLNQQLLSSEQQQIEWGFHFLTADWQWKISQFFIESEREIMVDRSVGGRTSYRNELETKRKGYEIFYRQNINDYWHAQLSAQYLDASFTQGQWRDNQLPGVAKYLYQAGIGYRPFANSRLSIQLDNQYRDKVATADDNLTFAPSWQLWNLSIAGDLLESRLQWWVSLNNLSDKNYAGSVIVNQSNGRSLEPGLGRHSWLGTRVNF